MSAIHKLSTELSSRGVCAPSPVLTRFLSKDVLSLRWLHRVLTSDSHVGSKTEVEDKIARGEVVGKRNYVTTIEIPHDPMEGLDASILLTDAQTEAKIKA